MKNKNKDGPVPGCSCKTPICKRKHTSMRPLQLLRIKNRGNRGHNFAVVWTCGKCGRTVRSPMDEQGWRRLYRRSPRLLKNLPAPTTAEVK